MKELVKNLVYETKPNDGQQTFCGKSKHRIVILCLDKVSLSEAPRNQQENSRKISRVTRRITTLKSDKVSMPSP